jgi:hypothetical protein
MRSVNVVNGVERGFIVMVVGLQKWSVKHLREGCLYAFTIAHHTDVFVAPASSRIETGRYLGVLQWHRSEMPTFGRMEECHAIGDSDSEKAVDKDRSMVKSHKC